MTEPDAGPSTSRTNQHGVTKADFSRWACTEEKRRAAQGEYIDKQNRASLREERAAKWASRGQELAQAGRDRRQTTKQLVSDQLAAARTRAKEVRANLKKAGFANVATCRVDRFTLPLQGERPSVRRLGRCRHRVGPPGSRPR